MDAFKRGLFLAAAVIIAVTTHTAFGQQAPSGGRGEEMMLAENEPGPGDRGAISEEKREAIRKKIETVRIWRLTEALKLDAQAGAKLAAIVGPLDQQRRDIQREQMEAMRALRQTLKSSKPDESKIKAAMETLEKVRSAMQALKTKEINDLKNILSIEQQARYLIFQQDFQHEIRGMIAGARGGQGEKRRMQGGQAPPEAQGQPGY